MTNTNQKRNRVCRVNLSSLQIHCDINRICFPGSLTDSATFASACRQALAGQWSSSVPSTANERFFEMTEKHLQVADCLDFQKKMNRIDLNHPEHAGVAVLLPGALGLRGPRVPQRQPLNWQRNCRFCAHFLIVSNERRAFFLSRRAQSLASRFIM